MFVTDAALFLSVVFMQDMCNGRHVQNGASLNLVKRTFDKFTHKSKLLFHLLRNIKLLTLFRPLIGQHGFSICVMVLPRGLNSA